jgi:pimeloyl-ACP methyl ester carboxylesterase
MTLPEEAGAGGAGPDEPRPAVAMPTAGQRLRGWVRDYAYVARQLAASAISRTPPHLLLDTPAESRTPILLIPGVYENWRFLQPVADHLHRAGHPVHVLDGLGYNTRSLADAVQVVQSYLDRTDLQDVTVVAHSKGGLIAKLALGDPQTLARVARVIAINTPFSGSTYADLFWLPSVRMFSPTDPKIQELSHHRAANAKISSLYSVFDPHIPQTSHLEGGENIILPTIGHFRPVSDPATLALISEIIGRGGAQPA